MHGVHSSTDGFPASVAVRPWVHFDVSGEYEEEEEEEEEEEGDNCRK